MDGVNYQFYPVVSLLGLLNHSLSSLCQLRPGNLRFRIHLSVVKSIGRWVGSYKTFFDFISYCYMFAIKATDSSPRSDSLFKFSRQKKFKVSRWSLPFRETARAVSRQLVEVDNFNCCYFSAKSVSASEDLWSGVGCKSLETRLVNKMAAASQKCNSANVEIFGIWRNTSS